MKSSKTFKKLKKKQTLSIQKSKAKKKKFKDLKLPIKIFYKKLIMNKKQVTNSPKNRKLILKCQTIQKCLKI